MPEAPLLAVRDLSVRFRTEAGTVRAVDGVTFDIGEREIVSIVGESGSGKTVTVMSILGLLGEVNVDVTGSIKFRGRELIGLPQREMRALRGGDVAMIFQDPMTALTPVYTIGWQIAEQLRTHQGLSAKAARDRAIELVAAVGIADPKAAIDRYPHQLSGGMRQRAVIAMALSCNPKLLLADEPTTALDVTVQAQILELLQRLREEFGSSIVLITHDMGVVAEVADRVMVMYAGRIVERGSKEIVLGDPQHPYTEALLESIPPIEGPRPSRLPAIPGSPPSLLALPPGCAFAPRCRRRMPACDRRPALVEADGHAVACFLHHPERLDAAA
ncbi:MAG: ABC transporter ATP-binding protein [Geminicoccaceae bacterium]